VKYASHCHNFLHPPHFILCSDLSTLSLYDEGYIVSSFVLLLACIVLCPYILRPNNIHVIKGFSLNMSRLSCR